MYTYNLLHIICIDMPQPWLTLHIRILYTIYVPLPLPWLKLYICIPYVYLPFAWSMCIHNDILHTIYAYVHILHMIYVYTWPHVAHDLCVLITTYCTCCSIFHIAQWFLFAHIPLRCFEPQMGSSVRSHCGSNFSIPLISNARFWSKTGSLKQVFSLSSETMSTVASKVSPGL